MTRHAALAEALMDAALETDEIEAAWRTIQELQTELTWRRCSFSRNRSEKVDGKTLRRLAERQNWRCCYCGGTMRESAAPTPGAKPPADAATLEHVLPRALGGPTVVRNLVAACRTCNQARGKTMRVEHVVALAHA